jgi:hypothetical protein
VKAWKNCAAVFSGGPIRGVLQTGRIAILLRLDGSWIVKGGEKDLGGARNIGGQPADSMQGAKTTDQNSACFNQDNMTIAISVKMTTAIFDCKTLL